MEHKTYSLTPEDLKYIDRITSFLNKRNAGVKVTGTMAIRYAIRKAVKGLPK